MVCNRSHVHPAVLSGVKSFFSRCGLRLGSRREDPEEAWGWHAVQGWLNWPAGVETCEHNDWSFPYPMPGNCWSCSVYGATSYSLHFDLWPRGSSQPLRVALTEWGIQWHRRYVVTRAGQIQTVWAQMKSAFLTLAHRVSELFALWCFLGTFWAFSHQ